MSIYTAEELKEFDTLTMKACSRDQVTHIDGRLKLSQFVKLHGKDKCDALFAMLMARDAKWKK